ncbi:hypothetical protein C8R45DRAFT_1008539 [Mycena sanguinolenta]|nr:hypothetical protein C8R45DRAFT_1008539 [Mycena sanguinolenta]
MLLHLPSHSLCFRQPHRPLSLCQPLLPGQPPALSLPTPPTLHAVSLPCTHTRRRCSGRLLGGGTSVASPRQFQNCYIGSARHHAQLPGVSRAQGLSSLSSLASGRPKSLRSSSQQSMRPALLLTIPFSRPQISRGSSSSLTLPPSSLGLIPSHAIPTLHVIHSGLATLSSHKYPHIE